MSEVEKEVDLYRDTPVRYLGYANEVGESFRQVVSRTVVRGSYLVAGLYVLADAGSKAASIWWAGSPSETRHRDAIITGVDVLLWQSLASVVVPGLTINRLCAATNFFLRRSRLSRLAKPLTVAAGLGSIPLIIGPIDRGVDKAMDIFVRPYLK